MLRKITIFIMGAILGLVILNGCANLSAINSVSPASPDISKPSRSSDSQSKTTESAVSPSIATESAISPSSTVSEDPLQPENNPPGDIPDTQVFINYVSTSGGYQLQVPEGWARTENGSDVMFIDKFDGVGVGITDSVLPLTADSIKNNQAVDLQNTERAVKVNSIKEITLKGGYAVVVSYDSNSEPDAVTNKQIRLENEKIYFLKDGKLAAVALWAPQGADNVDQWNLISNSFAWGQ